MVCFVRLRPTHPTPGFEPGNNNSNKLGLQERMVITKRLHIRNYGSVNLLRDLKLCVA